MTAPTPRGQSMAEPILIVALDAIDADLAAQYEGVDEWYLGECWDHIYPTCPGLARSAQPTRRGSGTLYPEGGDVCGWCRRIWRARKARLDAEASAVPEEERK